MATHETVMLQGGHFKRRKAGSQWKYYCHHERQRAHCKECGGSSICEHNRVRNVCRECGGSSICEHGRQRASCKECGGSSFCEHGRQRHACKECGGSSICEHGRRRSSCRDCGGTSICEHGRQRASCKECGGSSICEHRRVRSQCKECGGGGICEHGRVRASCKECGGSAICEHNRIRSQCKECGGSAICEHGRQRSTCRECLSAEQLAASSIFCKNCLDKILSPQRRRAGLDMCAECDVTVPERVELTVRRMLLLQVNHEPSAADDVMLGGCGDTRNKRRPDLAWFSQNPPLAVSVEVDEHSHGDRDVSCELAKITDFSAVAKAALGETCAVFVLRFNPHACTARTPLEDRVSVLAHRVNDLLAAPAPACSLRPFVEFFYYGPAGDKHVEAARNHPEAMVAS